VQVAFLLVLEGIDLAFTSSEDVAGVQAALAAATGGEWSVVKGGLEYPGTISARLDPFEPKVDVSKTLEVSVVDYDDTLISSLFREGDTSVPQSELAVTVDSDDTTFTLADVSSFPASGPVWIGNEESEYASKTGTLGGTLNGVTRGLRRLFYTHAGSAYRFGVPHLVDRDLGQTGAFVPRVTANVSQTWFNRVAGLYLIHRLSDGTWSAPFATDAATLLFAGRIEDWSELDGRVTFELRTILDKLQTTLQSETFKGVLAEGVWLTADAAQFKVKANQYTPGPGFNQYESSWVTLDGVDAYRTHQEIAQAINVKLLAFFNAVPGTPFPNTVRMDVKLVQSDAYGGVYEFAWRNTAAVSTHRWVVEVIMSPQLWQILGFSRSNNKLTRNPSGYWVESRELGRETSNELMSLQADGTPLKSVIRTEGQTLANVKLSVRSTGDVAFVPQSASTLPAAVRSGNPTGFLRVGKFVVPVKVDSTSGDVTTFQVTGRPLNAYLNKDGFDNEALYQFRDALTVLEDGGDPLPVEQVWCESGPIGELFLAVVASTGTAGYNHATYDRLPRTLGCGVPWTLLDSDSFLALGDTPYLLLLREPTPFLKLLESALKVLNKHVVWKDGRISVVSVGEEWSGATGLVALTEDNKAVQVSSITDKVTARSRVSRSQSALTNRVTLEYHHLFDGKPARTLSLKAGASQTDFEQERAVRVQGIGFYDEFGLLKARGSAEWAREVGSTLLAYLSRPLAYVRRSVDFQVATRLYPGARVSISDSALVNPVTGTRGVTNLLAWCVSVDMDWRSGVGEAVFAFSPELSWVKLGGLAPSARVDETASTGGYTNGYDAATKRLKCKPHEYSSASEPKDMSQFAVGDKVRVDLLSPDDLRVAFSVAAPPTSSWSDEIAAVDEANDALTLVGGLTGFPSSGGYYVVTYDDVSTVTAAQRAVRAFTAEAGTLSTGYSARDAYLYGAGRGTPRLQSGPSYAQPYRARRRQSFEVGEPFSVHTIHETLDWRNAALGRASCPLLLSQAFKSGGNTDQLDYRLVYGPVWVALYSRKPVRATVQASVARKSAGPAADADAKVRVTLHFGLPRGTTTGQPWASTRFLDGAAQSVELTIDNATTSVQDQEGDIDPTPGAFPMGLVYGAWLSVEAKVLDADDRVTLRSVKLREKEWG
jgi:hypothetical protein